MNGQGNSPKRICCPQCGGKVKVPTFEVGQRYRCPRCDAEIVVGQAAPQRPEAMDGQAGSAAPAADDEMPRLLRPGSSLESEEFSIGCPVCGTRLDVDPTKIGTTIKCPDCYSPVTVTAPPKRSQSDPAAMRKWDGADQANSGPTALQIDAQKRLEKARAVQEQEEAEQRESSPERFTEGLLAFFGDPQALGRLAALAIWLDLALSLYRYVTGMAASADRPAAASKTTAVVAALAMVFILLTFLIAAAACGQALVKDTSEGLRRIKHWPGVNVLAWRRDAIFIVSAGLFAVLPGIALGMGLAMVGFAGMILFTGAASFAALFPPILLSMFEANSAWVPFSGEVWNGIGKRPEPWKLTYLITTCVILGGVIALVLSLGANFVFGLILAAAMVALIMLYFRAVGRLFGFLAGRDVEPAAKP